MAVDPVYALNGISFLLSVMAAYTVAKPSVVTRDEAVSMVFVDKDYPESEKYNHPAVNRIVYSSIAAKDGFFFLCGSVGLQQVAQFVDSFVN